MPYSRTARPSTWVSDGHRKRGSGESEKGGSWRPKNASYKTSFLRDSCWSSGLLLPRRSRLRSMRAGEARSPYRRGDAAFRSSLKEVPVAAPQVSGVRAGSELCPDRALDGEQHVLERPGGVDLQDLAAGAVVDLAHGDPAALDLAGGGVGLAA